MKKIYIVLTKPNTLTSKLIWLFTKDQYTHASISLDTPIGNMYSFGRKHKNFPFIGTFKQEIFDPDCKMWGDVSCLILEKEVSDTDYEKVLLLLRHMENNKGVYKYNYLGLLYNRAQKGKHIDGRFFCSEFVYDILHETNLVDLQAPRNLVRPMDLIRTKWRVCYQGQMRAIKNLA